MATSTKQQHNVELVRRFTEEVFNQGDYDAAEELFAADAVQHGPLSGESVSGVDAASEQMEGYRSAFPDMSGEIDEQFVADDVVVAYYTYTGTHDGDFFGVPATGTEVSVNGISIFRIDDEIVETWVTVDFTSLLAQLGVFELPEN